MLQDKKARRRMLVPLIVTPESLDLDTPMSKLQMSMAELVDSERALSLRVLRNQVRKARYGAKLNKEGIALLCGLWLLGILPLLGFLMT
jgi:hypothetical protein